MNKTTKQSIVTLVFFALAIFCFIFAFNILATVLGLAGLIDLTKIMKSTTRKNIFEEA